MTAVGPDDKNLSYIPLSDVMKTGTYGGFYEVKVNYWLLVHPQRGVMVYKKHHVLGNLNRAIAEKLTSPTMYPWADVVQIPMLFMPHDCGRYL